MANESVSSAVLFDKELLGLISGLGQGYKIRCSQFLSEKEKVDDLMKVFRHHYDSNKLGEAKKVFQLLTEQQRLDWMPKFIVGCLKDASIFCRDFDKLRQIAQWLSEPQRTASLRRIRKRSLDVGDLGSAVAVSNLLNQPLRIKDVIRHFDGLSESSVKFNAELLPKPLRAKVLEAILPSLINGGYLDPVLNVIGLLGRGLTPDELETFREVCISKGILSEAKEVVALQKRPLNLTELNTLFDITFHEKNFFYHIAFEIANLMPKPQRTRRLNKLLQRSFKEGSIYGFQDTLKHLGRRATDLELIKIFSCYKLEENVHSRVIALVTLLPEPHRTDELNKIQKWFCSVKGDLYYSQYTANLMGRELTFDELESLLSKYKEASSYQDMFRVGKLLPEPRQTEVLFEILKLRQSNNYPSGLAKEVADFLLQKMEQGSEK